MLLRRKLMNNIYLTCRRRYNGIMYLNRDMHYLFWRQNNDLCQTSTKTYCQAASKIDDNSINGLHTPVMVKEVLHYLEPFPGKIFVDMTFGAGGHSEQILKYCPNIKIFAVDRDPIAHKHAVKLSEKYPGQLVPLLGRFSEVPQLLCKHRVKLASIDGFLFDFGCSSMQLDIAERGFSLSKNGPLDMRMDGFRCPTEPTAADILDKISETDLVHILKIYGEEKNAKKIARAIIDARYTFRSLKTTQELAQLVQSVISKKNFDQLGRKAHCATKTFQALRIFVNNELNEINYGITIAASYLKVHGRLVTIAFHSLEDTIVKRHLTANIKETLANRLPLKYSNYGKNYSASEIDAIFKTPWQMLHKHVVTPTEEEVNANPRSRSAKLRAITRVT